MMTGPFAPPPDLSVHGSGVTSLFWYTTTATAIAFAIVIAALAWFLLRYRAGKNPVATQLQGNRGRDLAVTLALAVTVFATIDAVLVRQSRQTIRDYLGRSPQNALKVEVMARQWAWSFRYPGADGRFNSADDVVTMNDIRVPVNQPVEVRLRSQDVIHAFYVPQFRIKQDVVPGRTTRIWFQAAETGSFEVACSQICGWAHYKMRAEGRVLNSTDFEAWYHGAQERARRQFDPADTEALWGWEWPP